MELKNWLHLQGPEEYFLCFFQWILWILVRYLGFNLFYIKCCVWTQFFLAPVVEDLSLLYFIHTAPLPWTNCLYIWRFISYILILFCSILSLCLYFSTMPVLFLQIYNFNSGNLKLPSFFFKSTLIWLFKEFYDPSTKFSGICPKYLKNVIRMFIGIALSSYNTLSKMVIW